jgi:hypothetical protein
VPKVTRQSKVVVTVACDGDRCEVRAQRHSTKTPVLGTMHSFYDECVGRHSVKIDYCFAEC